MDEHEHQWDDEYDQPGYTERICATCGRVERYCPPANPVDDTPEYRRDAWQYVGYEDRPEGK